MFCLVILVADIHYIRLDRCICRSRYGEQNKIHIYHRQYTVQYDQYALVSVSCLLQSAIDYHHHFDQCAEDSSWADEHWLAKPSSSSVVSSLLQHC